MSTPLMAGGAEKIRQYFVQGYYPLGTARPSAGFNPDSALVRAVILASCKPLAGIGGVWKNSREGAANYPYATTPLFLCIFVTFEQVQPDVLPYAHTFNVCP
jgi:hypothetical protein